MSVWVKILVSPQASCVSEYNNPSPPSPRQCNSWASCPCKQCQFQCETFPRLSPLSVYPSLLGASLSELTARPSSLYFLWPPFDHNLLLLTPRRHDGVLRHGVPPVQVGRAGGFLQVVLTSVLTCLASALLRFPVLNLCELMSGVKLSIIPQIL